MTRRRLFSTLLDALSGRPAGTEITPRMADLIERYRSCASNYAATDEDTNPVGASIAADLEIEALAALLTQRPANLAEFVAKFEAVIPATADDSEHHILGVLLADARALAGEGAR